MSVQTLNVMTALRWRSLVLLGILCLAVTDLNGQSSDAQTQTGIGAYYSDYFQGRPTASGEIFDQDALTAAHNGHPFGTRVRVTNLANGKSVVVTINDRLRSNSGILIDLTHRAAEELDSIHEGITQVEVTVVDN